MHNTKLKTLNKIYNYVVGNEKISLQLQIYNVT